MHVTAILNSLSRKSIPVGKSIPGGKSVPGGKANPGGKNVIFFPNKTMIIASCCIEHHRSASYIRKTGRGYTGRITMDQNRDHDMKQSAGQDDRAEPAPPRDLEQEREFYTRMLMRHSEASRRYCEGKFKFA